jgi:hypothetical protein
MALGRSSRKAGKSAPRSSPRSPSVSAQQKTESFKKGEEGHMKVTVLRILTSSASVLFATTFLATAVSAEMPTESREGKTLKGV